jgi:predicted ATPase
MSKMNKNQINCIEIKGFKSIKEARIDFSMLNVLIGANGAGKSNLISLFVLLQQLIDKKLQNYVSKLSGPDALLHFGSKETDSLEIGIYFGENGYRFRLTPTQGGQMMFDGEWFFWKTTNLREIGSGHLESLWTSGTKTRIDDYIKPIFKNQKWRVYHFHDTSDAARLKKSCSINENIELLADAGNLAAFLFRLRVVNDSAYWQIIKTIRLVAPFFDDFVLIPDRLNPNLIRLEWRNIDSEVIFNPHQLSDGTLRFICLATLLLQPAELSPETIIIDEPELGLHPYAIKLLASMLQSASEKKQIIVSTQSVELLNEFDASDVIVVDHVNDASEFRRLSEDELKVWLEDDYSLGELWKKNLLGGRPSK